MDTSRFLSSAAVVILIVPLLAGCGAVAPASPAPLPTGPGAEWLVVVIGDNSMWGHGEAIASQVEKDLGVQVSVAEFALPSMRAGLLREVFETGKSSNARLEELPDIVRQAEVVVMFANPLNDSNPSLAKGIESCFLATQPKDCSQENFTGYLEDLQAIWAKIIELRKGNETILVATDFYNPMVSSWNDAGIFADCTACWVNMSGAARQAAEAFHIPFISRYDAFNGPDLSVNINEMGYIQEDGEHPAPRMGEEFAKMLAEFGYLPYKEQK